MLLKNWRLATGLFMICTALGVALAIAPSSVNSRASAAEPEAKALAAGDIDPVASRIYVRVGKRRLGHEHGVEGLVKSGHLNLAATENVGEIVFDTKSFKADSDAARKFVGLESTTDADEQVEVTKTMTGKGVLDVAKYPTATFTVTTCKRVVEETADGNPSYELKGDFNLHGKQQPLAFTASIVETKDGKQRLSGKFTIKQTDYGITPYSAVGGLVAVTDELKISGELWVQQ